MEKMSTLTFPDGSDYEITDAEARRLVSLQQQTIEQQQQTIEQQQQTIDKLNKNMNGKGVYPLITTEQGGTITIPDITQYDLLIFYMDVNSADATIGATQQFTFVVSHLVNRYGKIYFTGKGGNDDTNAYVIFDSATSFRVLKTADVNAEPTVNAVYGVKL